MKRASLAVVIALFAAGLFAQNAKFGHVNLQEILVHLPEYDSASNEINQLETTYNLDYERLQVELNRLVEAFRTDTLSSDAMLEIKAKEIEDSQARVQAFQRRANATIQQRTQALLQPIYGRVMTTLETKAEELGLIYVFEVSNNNPIYISDKSTNMVPVVLEEFGLEYDPDLLRKLAEEAARQQQMQQQQQPMALPGGGF